MMRKLYILILLVFFTGINLFSQTGQSDIPVPDVFQQAIAKEKNPETMPFRIRKIVITGNRKTNEKVILRELPFKTGDQYLLSELVKKFEDARRQLLNTVLFNEVIVALKSIEGYDVDILVEVKERWYLFPVPFFKNVDRNLNQWLVENKGKLNRVNYGIKLLYNNATGNNDKLNVWLMNGYTKQLSASYDRLYIDKKMNWGLNSGFALGKNREINYNTLNNKQLFFKDTNSYVRSFFRSYAELTYRPAIKTRHRFGLSYVEERVNDTIVFLNPSYFKNGRSKISYPEIYYTMNYFDVDYIPYPLQGYLAEVSFTKKGLNNIINLWQLSVKAGANWKLAEKTYFGTRLSGTVKLPFHQPYFNQRLLGYNDFFMQGYEYYVVDGVAGGYLKTTVTRELVSFYIHRKRKDNEIPFRVPFHIYAKAFANAGYFHNPEPGANNLNNKMLYSGGVGIDILTHYDFTLRLEWSFNQLGQNGLFLHKRSNF